MENGKRLAELLFPHISKTPEYYESKYPVRDLKEGARVTRFAPSPTGFLHFGNLFTCLISYKTAKSTDGIFYVRVEDTDQKRKIEGAVGVMLNGLSYFGIVPDEGVTGEEEEKGNYGPYYQSQRKEIYQAFAKNWLRKDTRIPVSAPQRNLTNSEPHRKMKI